ncbi:hypothetical protein DMH26_00180 [Streptomyces sp. WAC 05379]|nr:hypothetical protein DMH26_00180 [Streptomyces sp. WAC 05379]
MFTAFRPGRLARLRRRPLAAFGVGLNTAAQLLVTARGNPDRLRTEASFAALCGVAPAPASSGRTNRHRLSRGGDHEANSALYRIALVRSAREYVARQIAAGRTKQEIIRLLKRAIAWEICRRALRRLACRSLLHRTRHTPRRPRRRLPRLARRRLAPAATQLHDGGP